MRLRINFSKPGAGFYQMFLNVGEKLQFYRGRARRVPKDPENVFNTIPISCITSIEILEDKKDKGNE